MKLSNFKFQTKTKMNLLPNVFEVYGEMNFDTNQIKLFKCDFFTDTSKPTYIPYMEGHFFLRDGIVLWRGEYELLNDELFQQLCGHKYFCCCMFDFKTKEEQEKCFIYLKKLSKKNQLK